MSHPRDQREINYRLLAEQVPAVLWSMDRDLRFLSSADHRGVGQDLSLGLLVGGEVIGGHGRHALGGETHHVRAGHENDDVVPHGRLGQNPDVLQFQGHLLPRLGLQLFEIVLKQIITLDFQSDRIFRFGEGGDDNK